jgi:hypothetical protein
MTGGDYSNTPNHVTAATARHQSSSTAYTLTFIQLAIMSSTKLPDWPPSNDKEAQLLHQARDYALSHAIVYRPPSSDEPTPFETSVIHAPFALYPSPFPRQLFELATDIQITYSELYARISTDFDFLEQVIGGNVSKVDAFQGELWRIAKAVREEGPVQVCLISREQTFAVGAA